MYFEEWAASVIHKNDKQVESQLRIGFECFDKSGSGEIDMNEIIKIMAKNLKDYIHEEDVWNQIVKESDADGSGTINFDEFKEMMRNI